MTRGRILDQPISIHDAADLLGKLRYANYTPGRETQIGELWAQVESRISAVQPLPPGYHLYRPVEPESGKTASPVRTDCPYAIAAYLRLWAAATSRHVRGLFDTGSGGSWAMVDLAAKASQLPRFWVGLRFGGVRAEIAGHPFSELPFELRATAKEVNSERVSGTWGSNDPDAGPTGFRGDEYFDYYHREKTPPPAVAGKDPWRPAGDDGLILFYVNQRPGDPHPTVLTGVCIPRGGPDQFAAIARRPPSDLTE